jgi:hypothetical protein
MSGLDDTMIDRVPTPASNIETEVIEGEVLLYHPQKTRAVYLNSMAAIVWSLCDGSRHVREIIDLISESYPDAGNPAEEVFTTLKQLEENDVLVLR